MSRASILETIPANPDAAALSTGRGGKLYRGGGSWRPLDMFDTQKLRDLASSLVSSPETIRSVREAADLIDRLQSAQAEAPPADNGPHFSSCTPQFYDRQSEPYHLALTVDGALWLIEGATMRPVTVAVENPLGVDEYGTPIEPCEGHPGRAAIHHDIEGVGLCQECWDSLLADTAAALSTFRPTPGTSDGEQIRDAAIHYAEVVRPSRYPEAVAKDQPAGREWGRKYNAAARKADSKPLQATVDLIKGYDHDGPGADDGGAA